jgi:hypothetical protein
MNNLPMLFWGYPSNAWSSAFADIAQQTLTLALLSALKIPCRAGANRKDL